MKGLKKIARKEAEKQNRDRKGIGYEACLEQEVGILRSDG
jgi:hypothetical protein